jgi:adenine-specific DNA-methyltransferase
MTNKKQKLELTWIGKDKRPKLEPRILLEDPSKSYHAKHKVSDADQFDNKLIFGDNLLALKALEQEYAGKVKCVFIDPPYNTGSAFTHYDDGLEHSIWLGLMRDRLEIIRNLLAEDGSLWITIDDNEAHYLKVLCDEIFGRVNFITNAIWQKKFSPQNDEKLITASHDHLLVISKNKTACNFNQLDRNEAHDNSFSNPDNDPRGPWSSGDMTSKTKAAGHSYPVITPAGVTHFPASGRQWAPSLSTYEKWLLDNRIWFGKSGKNKPRVKQFLSEVQGGIVPLSIWLRADVGDNQDAKREVKNFNDDDIFDTPKPEKLIQRVLHLATNPGDLVLDSFAGSGTTGAVAHKMGRRWIMVELGEHCHTHIIPRLQKVIDGTDQGGISKAVNWQGGGGFRYYKVAPSLLEKDRWGQWIINREYNAAMLAEALCKLEGFSYAPSDTEFWNHGYSTENDRIYVTTQSLSLEQLQAISEEVGNQRTLLICCSAFRAKPDQFANLTLKKIPKMVLNKCEWAHDDYSLNVENLPMQAPDLEVSLTAQKSAKTAQKQPGLVGLFDEDAQS